MTVESVWWLCGGGPTVGLLQWAWGYNDGTFCNYRRQIIFPTVCAVALAGNPNLRELRAADAPGIPLLL